MYKRQTLEGTASTIKVLEKKGINMIEIGIPFSDPMADGPVIQHAEMCIRDRNQSAESSFPFYSFR